MDKIEWDQVNEIIKFHPLLNWTNEELQEFVHMYQIPVNPLHDKGFVSIGCAPCTRAIRAGEDFRAGRWWWEQTEKKECGLHVHAR
jgi:phosphoadenosine phosphosulfate reductase